MNRILDAIWEKLAQTFAASGNPTKPCGGNDGIGARNKPPTKSPRLSMLALEPRLIFDGVAVIDPPIPQADVAENPQAPPIPVVNADVALANTAVAASLPPAHLPVETTENNTVPLVTQVDIPPKVDPVLNMEISRPYDPVQARQQADSTAKSTTTLSSDTAAIAPTAHSAIHSVLIIDGRVPDKQAIINAAAPDVKIIILDPEKDGVQQIATALQGMHDITSISIVSHGDDGVLLLGNSPLFNGNLANYSAEFQVISQALNADGDILLYGCDVGAGTEGQAFLAALATATGADIAASTDDTGSIATGGNWNLEIATGAINYPSDINTDQLADYDHLLVTSSVSTVAQLKAAITTGNTDNVDDIITITGNITFASAADAITINVTDGHTMAIVGGGFTLSGNNLTRVLNVSTSGVGSAVTIDNLTISNGFVTGAGGDRAAGVGGAGSDALGANIFNAGTLTITNSTITAGKAAGGGGAGGNVYAGTAAGAGGGGGGFGTTFGGASGNNFGGNVQAGPSAGTGGQGGGFVNGGQHLGGLGGTATGGAGANYGGYSFAGNGGTANNGSIGIGGGGGGAGYDAAGGRGGNAVGGIYNTGTLIITGSTITNNIGAGGGGGGGGSTLGGSPGNGGTGGSGTGALWNVGGTVQMDASSYATMGTTNAGGAGSGGSASGGGNISGASGTATSKILTTSGGTTDTNYTPDTTPPTVSSVTSSTANGTYKVGDTVSVQVTFSEVVNVTGTPQLTLETGTTDRVVNYASGSGTSTLTFTYTVQAGDTSADLDYQGATALGLNGGTIKDAVGNNGTLTLASPGAANSLGANKAIVIDGVVPTVSSVNSSTANGAFKVGEHRQRPGQLQRGGDGHGHAATHARNRHHRPGGELCQRQRHQHPDLHLHRAGRRYQR